MNFWAFAFGFLNEFDLNWTFISIIKDSIYVQAWGFVLGIRVLVYI
jgi:hypothetical protein